MNRLIVIFLITSLFTFFCIQTGSSQIKTKLGFGIGLNYATLNDDGKIALNNFPDLFGYRLLPTIKGAIDVSLMDRLSVALEPGISWLGAKGLEQVPDYGSPYLDFGLKSKLRVFEGIGVLVGGNYAYLLEEVDLPDSRHFLYAQLGAYIGLFDWVEVSLSAHKAVNSIYNYNLTDMNGNSIGNTKLKSAYFQLSIMMLH